MGGYQLMISADIFRGRYRESLESAKAHRPGQPLALSLRSAHGEPCVPARPPHHGADSVQLVSAVRPQSADLCSEYFLGEAGDYRKATQRVYHAPGQASFIELPVVTTP